MRQRLKLETFAGFFLVGARSSARSLLCSKEQRSLRERQAHSQSRERPDGRRFESGRAHQGTGELTRLFYLSLARFVVSLAASLRSFLVFSGFPPSFRVSSCLSDNCPVDSMRSARRVCSAFVVSFCIVWVASFMCPADN